MTAPAATTTTTWTLDPAHSAIEFSARHMMITTVKGRFSDATATLTTDGVSPRGSQVDVVIKAASIDTRSEQRDGHLRSADFLDVERFAELTFRGTKVEGTRDRFTLTGDLSIRDTTRPITLDVTFEGAGTDPWGGQRMGFTATGSFDRRDFGLVWNQALEAGGVLVSNDVKLQIDAQFTRAQG